MKRHNQILIGVLVLQIALGVFVFWPKSTTAVESEPLFPDMEASDIIALTIADAEGNTIHLEKSDDAWVLPEADEYPARAGKIEPLLEKLAGLSTDRLVTRTDTSHKRLQVHPDDFVRRIELETMGGATHTLYLGSSPRYGATHFRLEGQSETYLTADLTSWEVNAQASNWIDTTYVRVPQADVSAMTLENANGEFAFAKGGDGQWTMADLAADETVNQTKVTSLVQQASSISMLAPLGKEEQADYGLNEPSAVVALETVTETVTLRVGAQNPETNRYVVKSSGSPYFVEMAESNVKTLVESGREAFLQKPPTPTAETGADGE